MKVFQKIYKIFIYVLTAALAVGFLVLFVTNLLEPDIDELLNEQQSVTYGVISQLDSHDSYLHYYVDNKRYISKIMTVNSFVLGDIFEINYYPPKPTKSKVVLENPVFLKSEKISDTRAEIIKKSNVFKSQILFRYNIGLTEYKRIQYISKDIYDTVQVGNSINIIYWTENPQRAIMILEN